jgi:hypothetical protein
MISAAIEQETSQKMWEEWLAFAPIAALLGKAVNLDDFLRAGKAGAQKKASDKDIEDIRRRFGL